jgi:hypothetical protein
MRSFSFFSFFFALLAWACSRCVVLHGPVGLLVASPDGRTHSCGGYLLCGYNVVCWTRLFDQHTCYVICDGTLDVSVHMQLTTTTNHLSAHTMQCHTPLSAVARHWHGGVSDGGTNRCILKLAPSDGIHWVQQPLHPSTSTSTAHRQWILFNRENLRQAHASVKAPLWSRGLN